MIESSKGPIPECDLYRAAAQIVLLKERIRELELRFGSCDCAECEVLKRTKPRHTHPEDWVTGGWMKELGAEDG